MPAAGVEDLLTANDPEEAEIVGLSKTRRPKSPSELMAS